MRGPQAHADAAPLAAMKAVKEGSQQKKSSKLQLLAAEQLKILKKASLPQCALTAALAGFMLNGFMRAGTPAALLHLQRLPSITQQGAWRSRAAGSPLSILTCLHWGR